jgi:hypothetical protein
MPPISSVVQEDEKNFLLSTFVAVCNDFSEVCWWGGDDGTLGTFKNNKLIKKSQCRRNQVFSFVCL